MPKDLPNLAAHPKVRVYVLRLPRTFRSRFHTLALNNGLGLSDALTTYWDAAISGLGAGAREANRIPLSYHQSHGIFSP